MHAGLRQRGIPTQPLYAPHRKTLELSSGYEKHAEMGDCGDAGADAAFASSSRMAVRRGGVRRRRDGGGARRAARRGRPALQPTARLSRADPRQFARPCVSWPSAARRIAAVRARGGQRRRPIRGTRSHATRTRSQRLLAAIRATVTPPCTRTTPRLAYDGIASAIGVPMLVDGVAVGQPQHHVPARLACDSVQARGALPRSAAERRRPSPGRRRRRRRRRLRQAAKLSRNPGSGQGIATSWPTPDSVM